MLVPRPPLSLMTTVWPRASATAASSGRTSSRCATSRSGSMLSSGMVPVAADRSCSWKRLNTDIASSGTPAARILSVAARSPSVVMRQPYDAGMARDPEKSARRSALRAQRRAIAAARDLAADGAALAGHVAALLATPGARRRVRSSRRTPRCPASRRRRRSTRRWRRTASGCCCPSRWPTSTSTGTTPPTPPTPRRPLGPDAVALADLVLAPGLAVDRTGTRMGQGGGCYDKALPRRRPGTPVVVVLHPGSCSTRTSRRCRASRTTSRSTPSSPPTASTDLGLSPWRPAPSGLQGQHVGVGRRARRPR